MKKLGIIALFLFLGIAMASCVPEDTETEEIPDFSTYTEVEVTSTLISKVYKLVDIELTKDNSIYMAVGEAVYKGTYIGLEEEGTLFSIEEDVTVHDWVIAVQEGTLKGYYK